MPSKAWISYVRGDVILCCDTPGNVQKKEYIYECGYEGYDGHDKSEGPDDIHDLMYVTERPVGDCKRCPDLSVYW